MGVLREFRAFALRGNVVDLAVAVIIGAAFGKVVDSLVKHIILPVIAVVLPVSQDYGAWKVVVRGKEVPYGLFIGEIVSFVTVAFAVFLIVVKFVGWATGAIREEPKTAPPAPTRQEVLLAEIRDLLRVRQA
jgi:large conductance mechanosensitive channel